MPIELLAGRISGMKKPEIKHRGINRKGKFMKAIAIGLILLAVGISAGCNSDIVCTDRIKLLDDKCVYIKPLNTEDPAIGRVLRDTIEKEFLRRNFELCDPNKATILISGSAFLTERSQGNKNFFGASSVSSQAIESVSLLVKDNSGELLASASYDNKERYTAARLGKKFGGALANKLK